MQIANYISNLIIPLLIVLIFINAYINKVNVYESFIEGAKEGIKVVKTIMPTLIGLMLAIGIIRVSGVLNLIIMILRPIFNIFNIPKEIIPLILMRPISYSGSLGFLFDIFKNYGTDSYIGRVASVIMCCTETILYTMSLYLLSVKIKKSRYILKGAILSNIVGIITSLIVVKLIFY